ALDMLEDKKITSQAIALKHGPEIACKISSVLFAVVVLISFIPLIVGGLGSSYLAMILIMDTIIVFSIFKI
ncbi:MAG: hypothetical protein KUA33_07305, partial [Methanobacterium sp.]|nr:hypothetical protein [Methanobacterium sp.]